MNCPKCGAKSVELDRCIGFECGSWDSGSKIEQSGPCAELCELRKRVAFAEKWREVVLRDAPAFLDHYTIEHVLVADPSDSETVRKAFDAAVRKEME